jgi:hypothetical protein
LPAIKDEFDIMNQPGRRALPRGEQAALKLRQVSLEIHRLETLREQLRQAVIAERIQEEEESNFE